MDALISQVAEIEHAELLDSELLDQLAAIIDPQKIARQIFISDNETPPSNLYGTHLIEAIIKAAAPLPEEDQPQIIALMCSSPGIVEDNPDIFQRWDAGRVEVINKLDTPIVMLWIGQVIQGFERGEIPIRFRDFFQQIVGVEYKNRTGQTDHRDIQDARSAAQTITEAIRDLAPDSPYVGSLRRIPLMEIEGAISNRLINFQNALELLNLQN